MEVGTIMDRNLQHVFRNRLVKNNLTSKYKLFRQEYNRERRRFLAEAGFQQQNANNRPEIIPLFTAAIREEHQRLVKQHKNSVTALENNQKIRLTRAELELRIVELPLKIQALEDLRSIWRALQNYASDMGLTEKMAFMLENQKKNIIQTVYQIVQPVDQPHIDLFIQCFKNKECVLKWKQVLGTPPKWRLFFTN